MKMTPPELACIIVVLFLSTACNPGASVRREFDREREMRAVEAAAQASAEKLAQQYRDRMDAAVEHAKSLVDEFDRKKRHEKEMEAAHDRLQAAQMAAELAGEEARRQMEIKRLREQEAAPAPR